MRVRWFHLTGLFLLIAVVQSGIHASFETGADRFARSLPLLAQTVTAESLSTFSIEPVGSFPGGFRRFVPNDQGVATYEADDNLTRLFSFDGTELLSLSGNSLQYAPNGLIMTLELAPPLATVRLMTSEGTEIASFPGRWARFVPDTELLIIRNPDDRRSQLVNLAGEELAVLEGRYLGEALGPRDIVTVSRTANGDYLYHLYDLEGGEIASFPGDIESWTAMPDHQSVLVSEAGQTRWFDRNGVELATFPGSIAGTLPDGQANFLVGSLRENSTRLVSLDGEEMVSYTGRFVTLTPNHQGIVTNSLKDSKTRIYALDGAEIAVISGNFRGLSPNGEGVIVNVYSDDDQRTGLYTLEGGEIATFAGAFRAFWPELDIVITASSQRLDTGELFWQTHLYRLDGEALATVEGSTLVTLVRFEVGSDNISPNQELLAVSSNVSPLTTELYRIRMGE